MDILFDRIPIIRSYNITSRINKLRKNLRALITHDLTLCDLKISTDNI